MALFFSFFVLFHLSLTFFGLGFPFKKWGQQIEFSAESNRFRKEKQKWK